MEDIKVNSEPTQKVLLTSVCRPFGGAGEGDSVGAELFHAQVTRAQGIFSLRQVIRCWAIDYLAENIEAPCVVLHYPSEGEFVRELKADRYHYVGINFVVATFHKVRRMVKLIRKYAPHSKIVLGGYGTVLPNELLTPFADYICREEGIGFMRRLLGEGTEKPILHPYAPIPAIRLYSYQQPFKVGHLTAGLGCPNGCDFCCTSYFFKRRYVPFLKTGRDIYEEIRAIEQKAKARGDALSGFIFIDEDFFLYKKRAREFLECARKGGKPLSLMGFGSVRGLSQFSADEIAEMGFDTIWTAFEGAESGYGKLQGKSLEELYASLKSRGVALLSSMIIGFPYQDSNRVLEEFDRLMNLGPSLTQILIYFAFPGTPFHKQVLAEGRYLPEYQENPDLRRWDGFAMHFKHSKFSAPELEGLQKELYRQDFERLGPSIVRLLGVWFEGYKNLRHSPTPLLRARAEAKLRALRSALPGIFPAMLFAPNKRARSEARALFREIQEETGNISLRERLMCLASPLLAVWTGLAGKLRIFQQPGLLRIERRIKARRHHENPITRLQGGFHARPLAVLAEDLSRNMRDLWAYVFPKRGRLGEEFSASAVTRLPVVNPKDGGGAEKAASPVR
ncbi:MAG: B12-binding domain-containing radical SAM protein [Nitrospinota bacterium]